MSEKKKEHVITETDGFSAIENAKFRRALQRVARMAKSGEQISLLGVNKTKKRLADDAINKYRAYQAALREASEELFPKRDPINLLPFNLAPEDILLDHDLTDHAKIVMIRLIAYHLMPGAVGCFPSQELLAQDLGKSIRSIQRSLKELWDKKYIVIGTRRTRGHGNANMYILNMRDNRSVEK